MINIINTFKLKIGLKKDIYKKNYEQDNYWRNEINKINNYNPLDYYAVDFLLIIYFIIFLIGLWFFTYIIIPLN